MSSSSDDEQPLVSDPKLLSEIEARNSLLQFDEVRRLIPLRIANLQLAISDVCHFQSLAVRDIWRNEGRLRRFDVEISNSPHTPPHWQKVPDLLQEMCAHANQNQHDAIYCSSYIMWRLNWIHPFEDGNGRTSRALSYLALCAALGIDLPGRITVPDQISQNKGEYYGALEAADTACRHGTIDVSVMAALIVRLLKQQLAME